MKIYNCITFFNELDLLDIRLNIMSNYVDKFIICEMDATHQSNDKEFYFENNQDLFKKFEEQIVYLKVKSPKNSNPWVNENFQRDIIEEYLKENCEDDDLIITQDADEILCENFIEKINGYDLNYPHALILDFYRYYINAEIINFNNTWASGPIYTYKYLKESNLTLTQTREMHRKLISLNKVIDKCGWHWTFLGGAEAIANKLKSYAHTESNNDFILDIDRLKEALKNNEDACTPGGPPFRKIEMTEEKFPKYILNNNKKFKQYIL